MIKQKKQQGFVAIIVASLLMIVMTLIVIGLSRLMQRESRQALDRQLSTQAFYAAESGVNDVQARIGTIFGEKTDCNVTDWPVTGANGVIDPAEPSVAYTCLNYDTTPPELEYNNGSITTQVSKIIPIQSENGGNIRTIKFEWSGANSVKTITENCNQDFPTSRSNSVPILRLDLIRMPTATSFTRGTIIDETSSVYLYPQDTCGITSDAFGGYVGQTATIPIESESGKVISVNCDSTATYACSFEFTSINTGLTGSNRYLLRLKSIYSDADVRITATPDNGTDFEFVGAQTIVDSTGRANDVLRRIKVSLSNNPTYPIPEYVFQALDGVCKTIQVAAPSTVQNPCP